MNGNDGFTGKDREAFGAMKLVCEQNVAALKLIHDKLDTFQTVAACEKIEDKRADALQVVMTQQDILKRRMRWLAAGVFVMAGSGGVAGGALKDAVIEIVKELLQ